jgi:glycine oxidase
MLRPACWRRAAKPSPAKRRCSRQPGALAGFADELLRASGVDVELREEGTLVLALTADDQAEAAHRLDFQKKLGLPLEWLSATQTRAREPHLAGKIAGAVFSPQDHQVDNRKVVAASRIAVETAGVAIHEHTPIKEISIRGGRADGVVLEDGTRVTADIVVLAAGAWSRGIAGLPLDRRPPVRPAKGQMLALRMDSAAPLLNHVRGRPTRIWCRDATGD